MTDKINQILISLGLNNLEAEVYAFLLTSEPQTAYRIGKKIGKSTANVYKAIEAIAKKGGVVFTENEKNRLCSAVPAKEFLSQLQQSFQSQIEQAEVALSQLEPDYQDESVYHIESVSLTIARSRSMLQQAKVIAVIDVFPLALENIRESIIEAAERGVEIHLQVYETTVIPGVEAVCTTSGSDSVQHWQCQQLNIVVDGKEHLIALFDLEMQELYQAIWSRSLYVSCILHAGLLHEQTLMRLYEAKEDHQMLKNILSEPRFFRDKEIPGRKALFDKFVSNPDEN